MRFDALSVFGALADPHRLKILALLRRGPLSVSRIARRFQMSQPAVSHHLAVLRRAGCVTNRKQGQEVHYALEGCCLEDCCLGLLKHLRLMVAPAGPRRARAIRS